MRAEQWTLAGDPLGLDYGYCRNATRGFVHTLSVTRALTAERIHAKEKLKTEFAAVTDMPLVPGNKREEFMAAALREMGLEPVALEIPVSDRTGCCATIELLAHHCATLRRASKVA